MAINNAPGGSPAGEITGYGSVFGVEDSYGDVIAPGAFSATLAEHRRAGAMPAMLWSHDPADPIGVWEEMHEDSHGLYCRGRLLLETNRGYEAWHLLKAGALTGLSIGFRTVEAEKLATGGRKVTELDLWEVSPVVFPANPAARIERHVNLASGLDDLQQALALRGAALTLIRR